MNAWTTLGLERTPDVAEIRRAYARRLKAIDVDADPAAFIALRAALEWALSEAARAAAEERLPAADVDSGRTELVAAVATGPGPAASAEAAASAAEAPRPSAEPAPEPAAPAPPEAPTPAAPIEPANLRFVTLERLLFPGEGEPDADPDRLGAAVRAILHHPDMAQVDHCARIEDWLAEILWHALPRSEPAIPMVAAHFGWEAERRAVFRRPLVALVAQHADDLACVARLEQPEHRWHEAWRRLSRPGPTRIGFRDRVLFKPQVAQLLHGLRLHHSGVEHRLDAAQVACWDAEIGRRGHLYLGRTGKISWYGWLAAAWLALNLAALSARAFG